MTRAVHAARVARRTGALALGAALAAPPGALGALGAQGAGAGGGAAAPRGKAIYDRWCAGCHGDAGAGDGPGATTMLPRPRDFTRGVYKIRTTASGAIPTDADILHVVNEGMPGTAMPGWRAKLSERERDDVVAYLKSFSRFFARGAAQPIALGRAPSGGDDAAAGRAVYRQLECFKCHGQAGRGDGPSAPTLEDDWSFPIRAADLTASWNFRGGNTHEAIYARLRTGLDGTPMPSFADAIEGKLITDAQLWQVAAYVRSLSPTAGTDGGAAPRVREVVRARRAAALPASPDDSAWDAAERYWVPTVAQIIVRPRWFAPTVDGVWVQAMHDGRRLALRLVWHDPSRSPDAPWDEWLGRVVAAMGEADGPAPTAQGPDRLVVQWAAGRGDGAELPFFLGGSARRPAPAWRWTSAPDQVEVGATRGLGAFAPAPEEAAVSHGARHADGEWRLQLVRTLAPRDTTRAPAFVPGRAVPMALFVADGSSGEGEMRGAASAWYAVHLDVPTPARVYAVPAATVVLSAGLGVLLVARAQRREREAGPTDDAPEGAPEREE